ncbi:uncharacterized protein EKO05_0001870 [Ascochyta rabiei]|uniref:uncharacterized protein n=1 Tax=Didymella rabiei TaxID=5454 RepID=UPI0021FCC42A|nr:uncharacterized protein EKO05_0001870 [Ascochyta rabiei]UPX11256.1 hypothetical protein EKO05_0001870 [Ascochyta rabiei]
MVAFSRITFALAVAGLSSAQSFSGPFDFPSGAARPTSGRGGHEGGHGGDFGGFPRPTGDFHSKGPRPSGTGFFGAQQAQQSGEASFPTGGDFPAFPSGVAKPTGHHGHHGKGGKGGPAPTTDPSPASDLERRQQPFGTPPAFSGSFPAESGFPYPSGGFPSGGFPESGAPFPTGGDFPAFPSGAAKPSGHHGHHGKGGSPSGPTPTAAPSPASDLERRQQPFGTPPAFSGSFPYPSGGFPSGGFPESGAPFPTGGDFPAFPSGAAKPSGHHGHHGKGGKGCNHSGQPAPTGFFTSTIRGA